MGFPVLSGIREKLVWGARIPQPLQGYLAYGIGMPHPAQHMEALHHSDHLEPGLQLTCSEMIQRNFPMREALCGEHWTGWAVASHYHPPAVLGSQGIVCSGSMCCCSGPGGNELAMLPVLG